MRAIIIQQCGGPDSLAIENLPTPGSPIWKRGPDGDAESLASFCRYVGQYTKKREDIESGFDALDLDDYVSFGGKP